MGGNAADLSKAQETYVSFSRTVLLCSVTIVKKTRESPLSTWYKWKGERKRIRMKDVEILILHVTKLA